MDELCMYLNQQHRKFYSNDINDDRLVLLFRQWALMNFCVENVDFFLDVTRFKQDPDPSNIKQSAEEIFQKYIAIGAPHEVNINYAIRVHTMRSLVEPTRKTFNEAQTHILELMEIDCFPRFFRSQSFTSKYRCIPDRLSDLPTTAKSSKNSKPVPPSMLETKPRASSLKDFFKKVVRSQHTTRVRRSQSTFEAREHVVELRATNAGAASNARAPNPESAPRSPDSEVRAVRAISDARAPNPAIVDLRATSSSPCSPLPSHRKLSPISEEHEGGASTPIRNAEQKTEKVEKTGAARNAHHRYSKSAPVVTVHLLGTAWQAKRDAELRAEREKSEAGGNAEGGMKEHKSLEAGGTNAPANSVQSDTPNTSSVITSTASNNALDSTSNDALNNTSTDAMINTVIVTTSTNTTADNSSCTTTASNTTINDANSAPDINAGTSSDISNNISNNSHVTDASNDVNNVAPNNNTSNNISEMDPTGITSSNDSEKTTNSPKNCPEISHPFVYAHPKKNDECHVDFDLEFGDDEKQAKMSKKIHEKFNVLLGNKTGTLKNGRHSAVFHYKYAQPKSLPKIGNQRIHTNASPPFMRRK